LQERLRAIGEVLEHGWSGRPEELTDKETIATEFARWLSVCQKLKRDLRCLRRKPDWDSEQFRKEAIEWLAEKYSLSKDEMREIEDLPQDMTPWQMTMRLVARRHVNTKGLRIGEKTVETIYRARWKTHPAGTSKK
jgi:hypothetical protein